MNGLLQAFARVRIDALHLPGWLSSPEFEGSPGPTEFGIIDYH